MFRSILVLALVTFVSYSARSDELSDQLQTIVSHNSGSANVPGVDWVQEWIKTRLQDMGFSVELIANPEGSDTSGKLLVGTLAGESKTYISLIMHSDTVFEPSAPFQKITFSSDGKTANGPGVIDDKGGVIIALEGLKTLVQTGRKPKHPIRFIVAPSEETGSAGFLDRFRQYSADSWMVLGFEPAGSQGGLVNGRRGNRWYHIKVQGKESHAGAFHEEGINACWELAKKLDAISRLTRSLPGVTTSIGHIQGGQDKYNIVCGSAEAKVDTRFANAKAGAKLHQAIVKILQRPGVRSQKTGEPAVTTFEITDDSPSFSITAFSQPYMQRYQKIIQEIEGKSMGAHPSGGVADINYFMRDGIVIIDGLGAIGGKMHTPEEFILLSSLRTRAAALAQFLKSYW